MNSTPSQDDILQQLHKELQNASSESGILSILRKIKKLNETTTLELENVVSNGKLSQGHNLKRLDLLRTQLSTALNTSRDLSSSLSSASFVASRISSKVRSIDSEHNRVKEALQYVRDVMLLKASILGIRDAMDTRDWERAANYAYKARQLPDELINGQFAKFMVPTSEVPDYPRDSLTQACNSLCSLFVRDFDRAAKMKDMDNVSRYFRLFPLIGEEAQGLDIYAKFVCGIITTESRQLIQTRPADGSMIYGFAMSRLFENIATIVSQHSPIVEKHYGQGRMARVVEKIQNVADSQGGLIIDTFWDERRINKTLSEVKGYAYSYLVSSFSLSARLQNTNRSGSPSLDGLKDYQPRRSEDEGVDLKEVASFVNEMSVMMNRWSLYCSFLALRWTGYSVDKSTTNYEASGPLHIPDVIINSQLYKKVESVMSVTFESLAVFVFRRSVEKAFQLEDLPEISQKFTPETPVVTSVVDDVMYILNTLIQQIISTGQTHLIKTLVSNFRRILESDFVGIIQRKLRDEAPKQQLSSATPIRALTPVGRIPSGGSGAGVSSSAPSLGVAVNEERRLRIFLVYLNNLSVTAEYTDRILKSMDVDDNLPFENDAEVISDSLNSLSSNFRARCHDLINDGVQVLLSTVVNPRLRTLCSAMFRDADYMLSPDENEEVQVSSSDHHHRISNNFANDWFLLMGGFAYTLSPENYYKLLILVAGSLSRIMEKWIWSLEGKVNELGAIRLDRDISKIISVLTEGRYKVRDKFVRVAQIVMIIGFDDDDSEIDQDEIDWVLTDAERTRARLIRVDR